MKEKLIEKGYIVNDSNGLDWVMHKSNKEVKVSGIGAKLNNMFDYIPDGKEYMVIRDFRDDKEYEFSIILKDEDDYLFITDAGSFIDKVK